MNEDKTMKYFDIVKLIHPDWNPDIENPSIKMEEATKNKDDEVTLYKLAVMWGLIEDDTIEKVEINYVLDRGKIVKINGKHEGIIIDIIKRQSYVEVIAHVNGSFRKFQRKDNEDQDTDFYVIGYADDETYHDLDYKYQVRHAERQDG